jgi:hypothetical protein
MSWDPMTNPCPWWSAADTQAHAAWLEGPALEPVRYEEIDAHQKWAAGTPVLLRTGGYEHVAFVRLDGAAFGPRWLRPGPHWRVCPSELTLRNPRELWADPWELQLGLAMVSSDPRCAWLRGPFDPDEEPELEALQALALEELVRPPSPVTTPGPAPAPAPTPRRGWTRAEIEALRLPDGVVEPLNLAPGR